MDQSGCSRLSWWLQFRGNLPLAESTYIQFMFLIGLYVKVVGFFSTFTYLLEPTNYNGAFNHPRSSPMQFILVNTHQLDTYWQWGPITVDGFHIRTRTHTYLILMSIRLDDSIQGIQPVHFLFYSINSTQRFKRIRQSSSDIIHLAVCPWERMAIILWIQPFFHHSSLLSCSFCMIKEEC